MKTFHKTVFMLKDERFIFVLSIADIPILTILTNLLYDILKIQNGESSN